MNIRKKRTLRAELVDRCRSFQAILKMQNFLLMEGLDGALTYADRWKRVDEVLTEFQRKPANFCSRSGVGLAERIHRVEPTKMLEGTGRSFFKLAPDGVPRGGFLPSHLAAHLEEAYKSKGFDDEPPIKYGAARKTPPIPHTIR